LNIKEKAPLKDKTLKGALSCVYNIMIANAINKSIAVSTGLIDDVRIYNRALTRDEIKRLYNIGR